MVLGVAAALTLAALGLTGGPNLHTQGLGAAMGAILGLFVGLGRAVWRTGAPSTALQPARDPSPQLWDPWLDSGRAEDWTELEVVTEEPATPVTRIGELPAQRARVRPRVISPDTRDAVLLEDEIGVLVQRGERGLVRLVGGPGSGKSTALRHLSAILPPWMHERIRLLDDSDLAVEEADRLTVSTALPISKSKPLAIYALAPWSQDDLIEYLLAAHRECCPSVMARLKRSGNYGFLQGNPELWTVVLGVMAAAESIVDIRSALWRRLAAQVGAGRLREQVGELCLTAIQQISKPGQYTSPGNLPVDALAQIPVDAELFRLIRHRPVMVLMAADRLVHVAERGCVHGALAQRLPRELIQEAAVRLNGNREALQYLRGWMEETHPKSVHPMVASLLHAVLPEWRPDSLSRPRLAGAYLDGVKWSGINLTGVDLQGADLEAADLSGAHLEGANASSACFSRADLRGAYLIGLHAVGADFRGANLMRATARRAGLAHANLADAVLIDADLSTADLRGAQINEADFRGAFLARACLTGLELKLARFEGARFGGADLRFCNLEDMRLTAPDFHGANLLNALLTGSSMSKASFHGADLRDTGLAEVDWPGADLRDANLCGANFHVGSSRNGLVGSPIACEGSHTGFYTDDYNDQNVKPAEEIRKANLRGADVRGAKIKDVDFYLVDLRDAQYTADQAEHLRRCRAILEDRAVE